MKPPPIMVIIITIATQPPAAIALINALVPATIALIA